MPYTITREDADKDARYLRDALDVLREVGGGINDEASSRLRELAASIEAQIPKGATEEPTEFGSIVRAGYDEHTDRVLWVRTPDGWHAETQHGYHAYFIGLHNPEVLRVGIGEQPLAAWDSNLLDGQALRGIEDVVARGIRVLEAYQRGALTAERKDAYQNAINVLRELS